MVCVVLIAAFTSCEDFLQKDPTDVPSQSVFWQQKSHFDSALAGTYSVLHHSIFSTQMPRLECLSDNTVEDNQSIATGNLTPNTSTFVEDIYNNSYEGIARVHTILHQLDVMKDGQKALRLLQDYTKDHPISLDSLDIEFKLAKTNETLLRNYAEAQRGYQRIIDTQQNDEIVHEAYYRMGFVYRDGFANYTMAISTWQNLINQYYSNKFADQAQFAMAYTYEAYLHDYTQARAAYDTLIKSYPNSSLQNEARNGILRVEGK